MQINAFRFTPATRPQAFAANKARFGNADNSEKQQTLRNQIGLLTKHLAREKNVENIQFLEHNIEDNEASTIIRFQAAVPGYYSPHAKPTFQLTRKVTKVNGKEALEVQLKPEKDNQYKITYTNTKDAAGASETVSFSRNQFNTRNLQGSDSTENVTFTDQQTINATLEMLKSLKSGFKGQTLNETQALNEIFAYYPFS